MHATLTEHARCLFGDEYRAAPECAAEHREHYFVEELTFADADAILAMLRELCPNEVDGRLPVWVRNLAYRLAVLQRPDDPALLRAAAGNLWLHGPGLGRRGGGPGAAGRRAGGGRSNGGLRSAHVRRRRRGGRVGVGRRHRRNRPGRGRVGG
jgi:hypothetical protein